jgi:hypothetical protein
VWGEPATTSPWRSSRFIPTNSGALGRHSEASPISRIESIKRYRNKALDTAALIAALSTARALQPAYDVLSERQDEQLHDLIHDFAFSARKLVELVNREQLSSAPYTTRTTLFCSKEGDPDDPLGITMFSLRDVFGRIIHSDAFKVERGHVPQPDGNPAPEKTAWGFYVRSDRDAEGQSHFIFIEFLLDEFLTFDRELTRIGVAVVVPNEELKPAASRSSLVVFINECAAA